MSYLSDPANYDYVTTPDECGACYPAAETPVNLYLQLTGIAAGDAWAPGDPAPPNGLYELTYNVQCNWLGSSGPYSFIYGFVFPSWVLLVGVTGLGNAFLNSTEPDCTLAFDNTIASPTGNVYYGGSGLIASPKNTDFPAPLAVMDLLGLDPEDNYWIRPLPFTDDQAVTGFYHKNGHTNCLVQYDLS
jgi:hypothetical protein